MTKEQIHEFRKQIDACIKKAIIDAKLHDTPSEKTLEMISDLRANDQVSDEKIDNFILESRNDRQKIYNEVKEVKEQLKIQNGSVKSVLLWRERVKGNIDMIKLLFIPVFLAIIYLFLDKFLR